MHLVIDRGQQQHPGLQHEEGDPASLPGTGEAVSGVRCPVLGTPEQEVGTCWRKFS